MESTSLRLFCLTASAELGSAISTALGEPLAAHEEREFEDGEHKARPLDAVNGADVYVVQSLHGGPLQSANDYGKNPGRACGAEERETRRSGDGPGGPRLGE